MTTPLAQLFKKTQSENRAALIAYIPAGYPTQEGCKAVIDAFADAGVDAIEIGFPYSDPVMDGPTIQEAANTSLNAGTGSKEVFEALAHATSRGIPSVVMTYWNPVEKYGVQEFAHSISANSGFLSFSYVNPKLYRALKWVGSSLITVLKAWTAFSCSFR